MPFQKGQPPGRPYAAGEREEIAALYAQHVSIEAIAAKMNRPRRTIEHMLKPTIDPQVLEIEATKRRKIWESRFSDILVRETERILKDFQHQHRKACHQPKLRLKRGMDLLSCLGRVQSLLKPTPEPGSKRTRSKAITYTPNDIEPAPPAKPV